MEYYLDNQVLFIIRKNRKSKSLKITLKNGRSHLVSIPYYLPYKFAYEFIEKSRAWIYKSLENKKIVKDRFPELSEKELRGLKPKILTDTENRLRKFNQYYNFQYKKVVIKRHKTLWGSCTRKGTLNFNYKIHMLPDYLKDYLVVHELCHLKEFNHSTKFWSLVAETIPNFKQHRRELGKLN